MKEKKDIVCSLGMTRVVQGTVAEELGQAGFPKIKEPVPHLRFGKDIRIEAPLSQPILRVNLMVDIQFYKVASLRLSHMKKIRSVPIELTAHSGTQVTTCNVDKLALLGLKKKDLLSTAVGVGVC